MKAATNQPEKLPEDFGLGIQVNVRAVGTGTIQHGKEDTRTRLQHIAVSSHLLPVHSHREPNVTGQLVLQHVAVAGKDALEDKHMFVKMKNTQKVNRTLFFFT